MEGSEFGRQKPLLLLAYLALEGPKPRRYLAELFFMEARDPLNSLSRALSHLRRGASKVIDSDSTRAWTTLETDVITFLHQADAGELEACAALYQGAFLEDLNLTLTPELEEWVYGTREYLAGRYREVLLQLAENDAAESRLAQAAARAETAWTLPGAPELEPEHLERAYTLLLAGSSPRASDLRQEAEGYGIRLALSSQEARALLVSPEGEEQPHNLPPPKTSFIGREHELAELTGLMVRPECRLLTLHGMGGIGKSRLALQAARTMLEQGHFKDGIYFVPLDALASSDLIPGTIAERIGLSLQGQDDALTQVTRHIGNKRMLLILDNYEHLMEAALLPSELLASCPNLKLIVTSREVLQLEEEWVKPLDGLRYPETSVLSLEEAQGYDAVRLFRQRAKRARLDFTPTEADLPHILKICELTEGSPLALELAATWIRIMSAGDIAREISHNIEILASSSRNIEGRHQSIHAVLEQSWAVLSPKEREALQSLSLFVGGFTRMAASEVASVSLSLLNTLVQKALVSLRARGRYAQHPLVVQFAQAKLAAYPLERQGLKRSYVDFYSNLVAKTNRYDFEAFAELTATLDADLPNIIKALQLCAKSEGSEQFIALVKSLVLTGPYLFLRGYNPQLHHLLDLAASRAYEAGDIAASYNLLGRSADFSQNFIGDFDRAMESYQLALERAQQSRDQVRESVFLSNAGVVASRQGRSDAERFLEEACEIAQASNSELAVAVVLEQWGYVVAMSGEWQRADGLLSRALTILENVDGDSAFETFEVQRRRIFCLLNAGEVKRNLKDVQRALALYQKALALAQRFDNPIWVAHATYNLGELYLDMDRQDTGLEYLENALEIYQTNGATVYVGIVRSVLEKAKARV